MTHTAPVEPGAVDKPGTGAPGWRGRVKALRVDTTPLRTSRDFRLLFAAGTDAEWFEEELRALDLPTYRAAGRSYFGQQQVVDLLAYLRLLHNRYDDEALLTVLASPFVGVSNDALVLVKHAVGNRRVQLDAGDGDVRDVVHHLQDVAAR